MDLDRKTLLTAGVALIAGLLLGAASGGDDMDQQIAAAIRDASGPVAGLAESIDGLKADIAALGDQVSALGERVDAASASASAAAEAAAGVGGAVGRESESTRAAVAGVADQLGLIIRTMEERHRMMDERHRMMQADRATGQQAMGGAGMAEAGTAEAAPGPEPERPPEGARAGETVILEDGAIRVFVSAVGDAAGEVRVAVNGLAQSTLDLYGRTAQVQVDGRTCTVRLDAIDRGHAGISADCGG